MERGETFPYCVNGSSPLCHDPALLPTHLIMFLVFGGSWVIESPLWLCLPHCTWTLLVLMFLELSGQSSIEGSVLTPLWTLCKVTAQRLETKGKTTSKSTLPVSKRH